MAKRPNTRVIQVAFMVEDLDAAARKWVETTGIGPFFMVRDVKLDECSYRGQKQEPVEFSVALAQAGDVQIELIKQHCDRPSAYRDTIAKGAEGFHHLCYYCDDAEDYARTCAKYEDQGFATAIEGRLGNLRFRYVDTQAALGCMIEIVDNDPNQTAFFDLVAETGRNWDGVTDPIREATL